MRSDWFTPLLYGGRRVVYSDRVRDVGVLSEAELNTHVGN